MSTFVDLMRTLIKFSVQSGHLVAFKTYKRKPLIRIIILICSVSAVAATVATITAVAAAVSGTATVAAVATAETGGATVIRIIN